MRFIINYIRQCFCKHDSEFLREVKYYNDSSNMPYKSVLVYRCKKCGSIQNIKY